MEFRKSKQHDWWYGHNYCNAIVCFWSLGSAVTNLLRCRYGMVPKDIKSIRKWSFFLEALRGNVTREINKTWRKLFVSMWCFWKLLCHPDHNDNLGSNLWCNCEYCDGLQNYSSIKFFTFYYIYILQTNPYEFCIQINHFSFHRKYFAIERYQAFLNFVNKCWKILGLALFP